MEKMSKSERYKGIVGYTDEAAVSSDFNHDSHSMTFDAISGMQLGPKFVKCVAWYDNEWAYAVRMVEFALHVHRAGY